MMWVLTKIIIVLNLLCIMLYGTSVIAHKTRINPELVRKFVHCSFGLTCMIFPWIFDSIWELTLLCAGGLIILLSSRYHPVLSQKLGMGLHGIQRDSVGDLLFGISIVLLFNYCKSNMVLYVLPVLVLTISDSAAALVGIRYGQHIFATAHGQKSIEGSITFFIVTFVLALVILSYLTHLPSLHILLIAVTLGLFGSIAEAVTWHGWDNLIVPLGLCLLLQSLETRTLSQLLLTSGTLISLILYSYRLNRFNRLNTHTILGAILATYFFWETGGLYWLLPHLIVFAVHIVLNCLQNFMDKDHYRIEYIFSMFYIGFFWIFFTRHSNFPYATYLFILSIAIHIEMSILLRIKVQRLFNYQYPLIILVALFSGWIFLPVLFMRYPINPTNLLIFSFGFLVMIAFGFVLRINTIRNRWVTQSIYATIVSFFGLIPIYLHQLWLNL